MEQLNADRISQYLFMLKEQIRFYRRSIHPRSIGCGVILQGLDQDRWNKNFMCYGDFPESEKEPDSFYFPRGMIVDGQLKMVPVDTSKITEDVTHAWYEKGEPLHPSVGVTKPLSGEALKGAVPDTTAKDGKYSWIKAPRYDGKPVEVGPLAQCLVSYVGGNKEIKDRDPYGVEKA